MLKIFRDLLELLIIVLNKLHKKTLDTKGMEIIKVEHHVKGKFKTFTIRNPGFKEGKKLLHALFTTLNNDSRFVNFCNNKIIIIGAIINGQEYSFHHNVLINNKTTFLMYWFSVKDYIKENFGEGYGVSVIPMFRVKVWNGDDLKNKHIKITSRAVISGIIGNGISSNNITNYYYIGYKSHSLSSGLNLALIHARNMSTKSIKSNKSNIPSIKPYSKERIEALNNSSVANLAASDLETMEIDGVQVPILITYVNKFSRRSFMIDEVLLKTDKDLALNKLWKEYFDYITSFNIKKRKPIVNTIFFHNLGSFDGYFIYKAMLNHFNPDNVETIIDDSNKFITITVTTTQGEFVFKDSLRIFPMSLSALCKTFGVEGKLGKYIKPFNSLNLFKDPILLKLFLDYGMQDSVALYNALVNAQANIFGDFKLDIVSKTIVSTSSLAFNVLRSKFLKVEIPILNNAQDSFIRRSYFGGATDYYKKYVKDAKYYDVNSLYPYAMLNDMPGKMIKYHDNLSGIDLNKFFGFILAEVTIPKTLVPLLPYKSREGKTIFPTGVVTGIYFSEELKALQLRGYSITLIKGYEFERIKDLFTSFVRHFYELKKNAKGAERAMAKLIMNSCYGNFGRKNDLLVSKNVLVSDLINYVGTHIIKNIITINNEWCTILMKNNLPEDIINGLKINLETEIKDYQKTVNNNVAIASAITSYARIHMMDFKLNNDVIYSDTDSVILGNTIDSSLIGPELGQMKDELNGGFMTECYVLGIKQYGYHYKFENGIKECSVFAGVPRNSITFEDFVKLANGEILHRKLSDRFNKSFENLSIIIKPAEVTVQAKPAKKLVGNNYIPPHIIDLNHDLDNRSIISKLVRKYWLWLKRVGK